MTNFFETNETRLIGKRWHRISFKKRFSSKPIVLALAQSREGTPSIPKFQLPSVAVPHPSTIGKISLTQVQVPSIAIPSFTLPRISREDFSVRMQNDAYSNAISALGDWTVTILGVSVTLNRLRDKVANAYSKVGKAIGNVMNRLWDNYIKPQFDKVQSSVQTSLNDVRNKTQTAITTQTSGVNSSLSKLTSDTNSQLNNVIQTINSQISQTISNVNGGFSQTEQGLELAVQESLYTLYDFIGLAQSQVMSPIQVKNITQTGFDIFGLGDITVMYLAITDINLQDLLPQLVTHNLIRVLK